jgi:hypothetical protein
MSDAAHHIPDEHRLLTGKRRSPRTPRQIETILEGASGDEFHGRTIDVSRGGMLVELVDPAFNEVGSGDGAMRFVSLAARISSEFSEGMRVRLGDSRYRKAEVVRLVTRIQDMAFLLGCRFTPELTTKECRLLGVEPQGDETQVEAVLSVPLHANPPPSAGSHVQKPGHPLSPGPSKGR